MEQQQPVDITRTIFERHTYHDLKLELDKLREAYTRVNKTLQRRNEECGRLRKTIETLRSENRDTAGLIEENTRLRARLDKYSQF